MNYVLTAVLLLAILLFASGIYRLERARASYDLKSVRPEYLKFILKGMLRTVDERRFMGALGAYARRGTASLANVG